MNTFTKSVLTILLAFSVETAMAGATPTAGRNDRADLSKLVEYALAAGKTKVYAPVNAGTYSEKQVAVLIRYATKNYKTIKVNRTNSFTLKAKWNAASGNTMRMTVIENGRKK